MELGITDGEKVIVETLRGRIEARAKYFEGVDPRLVCVPQHGWPGNQNVNLLTNQEQRAPISGGQALKSALCRIRKA